MTTRETRLVENQERFRMANERLEGAVRDKVSADGAVPFLCECLDEDCVDTVSITLAAYKKVRSRRNRYIIVSGHPTIPGERVVGEADGYSVVEKE